MAIEPPPNIMKAGERPARVRTGAKTATKSQERDVLEKFRRLAEDPMLLVPKWVGSGSDPWDRHRKKLAKIQSLPRPSRRLKWAARGKHLWNAYAATLLVLEGGSVPSFASFKFRGRDLKFVYRRGTKRNALIGVQHFDAPEARLLGYAADAHRRRVYLLSGEEEFLSLPRGGKAPPEFLQRTLQARGVATTLEADVVRCAHVTPSKWRYKYGVRDLQWVAELCLDCVHRIGDSFHECLEARVLGPDAKVPVEPELVGNAFEVHPEQSKGAYEEMRRGAFAAAKHDARERYEKYSDVELAQWTVDELLRRLGKRADGFLLVGRDLWLANYAEAAAQYAGNDLERRALTVAFELDAPRFRATDGSLHKLLEPYWKQHGLAILKRLAGDLLNPGELDRLVQLNPGESLTALARVLGARERFREFLQFDDVHPTLEFFLQCLEVQRSGERALLTEKLTAGAKAPPTRALTLAIARALGEASSYEWQYPPHEKETAAFLEPYVRKAASATPSAFGPALLELAKVLDLPAPKSKAPATSSPSVAP